MRKYLNLAVALSMSFSLMALASPSGTDSKSQDQSVTSNQPLVFRTTTRDVIVDVVVTNGKGDPVQGLRKQDFRVYEDGKSQTIDYFQEHVARTLPPDAVKPLPKMPPGVYTNVPPAPPSDAVNVLLLDMLNTETVDQVYVRRQLLHFLNGMEPGTRTAIFALGSQLHFIQGFTSDTSVLLAALKNKQLHVDPTKNPNYHSRGDELDDQWNMSVMGAMSSSPSPQGTEGMLGASAGLRSMADALQESSQVRLSERTAITLAALQSLARYLANVPGRKNLLWFASSFPVNIFPTAGQLQDLINQRVYLDQIKKTANMMTASRVAVYPIEAEGVMQNYSMSPEQNIYIVGGSAMPAGGSNGDRGSTMVQNLSNENSAQAGNIFAMEQLAEATGGKAFYNTNNLNASMQHAIADGSYYYTIAYSPTNKKMDGKFRKIEIKVDGKKYKLAYRRGYNADNNSIAETRPNSDPLHPLLMLGMPNSSQILYGVRVQPAAEQPAPNAPLAGKNAKLAKPVTRYSVDFMIRWTDVDLKATANDRHTGRIEVQLLAYDREGHAVNWTGGIQMMSLTPNLYSAIEHSGVPAHLEIDLPKDKFVTLATGVYDWNSGKAGTLEIVLPQTATTASARK